MSGWSAPSEPRAVLFDLGNTLVSYYRPRDFGPILRRAVAAAAAELEQRRAALGRFARIDLESAVAWAERCNHERRDHRVRPLAERLVEVFRLPPEDRSSELLERLAERFLEPIFATARRDPLARETIIEIRRLGYKVGVLSNTPWGSAAAPWRAELERHGLLDVVDAAVFCVETGWRKPASQAFAHALARLGAAPEHTWFVGDEPAWDVAGARAAGLTPILLGPVGGADCVCIPDLASLPPLLAQARTV